MSATEDDIRAHARNVLALYGLNDPSIADEALDGVFGRNVLIANGTTREIIETSQIDATSEHVEWTVYTTPADEPPTQEPQTP